MAQKLGAQYACDSPLLKGNNRDKTCGNCFINGPNANSVTEVATDPTFMKFGMIFFPNI